MSAQAKRPVEAFGPKSFLGSNLNLDIQGFGPGIEKGEGGPLEGPVETDEVESGDRRRGGNARLGQGVFAPPAGHDGRDLGKGSALRRS